MRMCAVCKKKGKAGRMSKLADFFKAQNREFLKVARGQGGLPQIDKKPVRKLAVLTCMDTRLLYIVEPALGLNRGEAVVIKVAGARITEAFDSALGSLLVAVYELGVTDVAVVVHDDCGMVHTTADGLCEKMAAAGVSVPDIQTIRPHLEAWADPVGEPVPAVRDMVQRLRKNPYIPDSVQVYGISINPANGKIHVVEDSME